MVQDATVAQAATLAGDATQARHAALAQGATVARCANNKEKLDYDDLENQSSSKAGNLAAEGTPVENHSLAAAPREKPENADRHFVLVRAAYEKATGNRWKKSDSEGLRSKRLAEASRRNHHFRR
jgi:hypothetical protein